MACNESGFTAALVCRFDFFLPFVGRFVKADAHPADEHLRILKVIYMNKHILTAVLGLDQAMPLYWEGKISRSR